MLRRNRYLLQGLAAGVVAVAAMVVPGVSAMASSPLGTGPVCDREVPDQICLSVDGTTGDPVYGKDFSSDNQEKTTVAAALVCDGTDVVDGGNSVNCPFQEGTGLNSQYDGDTIVQMYNTHENDLWYIANQNGIYQEPQGTGYLWVLAPISKGSQIYYLVNVAVSGQNSQPWFACSQGGANHAIFISSYFQGGGQCEWTTP
jgi:hypothetical protein